MFAFKAVNKTHLMVLAAVCTAALSRKRELTTYNVFSISSGDPFTASQSSIGTHAERTVATGYPMHCGGFFLPLEPQAPLPAGYPAD